MGRLEAVGAVVGGVGLVVLEVDDLDVEEVGVVPAAVDQEFVVWYWLERLG